jgi:hypothetical protein
MKSFLLVAMLVVASPLYGQNKPLEVQIPSIGIGELQGYGSPENVLTLGLILVGIIGIWVAIRTLNHMRESSEQQLRAYVLMESASVVIGSLANPPQPDKADTPFAGMLIKNFGQTPAYKVVSWAQITVIPVANENTMPVVPPIPEQFTTTLGPGATFNKGVWFDRSFTPNEITDIVAGTRAIYLYGRIGYLDAFKKRRFANFRLRYTGQYPPPQNSILKFSEQGNDAN